MVPVLVLVVPVLDCVNCGLVYPASQNAQIVSPLVLQTAWGALERRWGEIERGRPSWSELGRRWSGLERRRSEL